MQTRFQKNLAIIFAIVIFISSCLYYFIMNNNNTKLLADDKLKIANLENEIALTKSATLSKQKAIMKNTTGYDYNRVKRDEKIAKQFLDNVFSWKSWEEYNKARNYIMATYKLKEDTPFMKTFMPVIKNDKINGKSYNIIDDKGFNLQYEDFTSYVTSIGSGYDYIAVVKISSTSKNGGKSSAKTLFRYKIDESGIIHDVAADVINNEIDFTK